MNKKEAAFIQTVKTYYNVHGRHLLPWRKTDHPYKILVSEIMLQQTQVDRVLPKYKAFLRQYPTASALAAAPLGDVLRAWQGLGYNRRAKMLHACVRQVQNHYRGRFPQSHEKLIQLPGVGPYTASALLAFAWNIPTVLIETNVRSAYLHYFFSDNTDVPDCELLPIIEKTMQRDNVREWYWALMDYGAYIKKEFGNPNIRSKHYAKQTAFKGSDREIRGALVRLLTSRSYSRTALLQKLSVFEDIRIDAQLKKLHEEGIIAFHAKKYTLPT